MQEKSLVLVYIIRGNFTLISMFFLFNSFFVNASDVMVGKQKNMNQRCMHESFKTEKRM